MLHHGESSQEIPEARAAHRRDQFQRGLQPSVSRRAVGRNYGDRGPSPKKGLVRGREARERGGERVVGDREERARDEAEQVREECLACTDDEAWIHLLRNKNIKKGKEGEKKMFLMAKVCSAFRIDMIWLFQQRIEAMQGSFGFTIHWKIEPTFHRKVNFTNLEVLHAEDNLYLRILGTSGEDDAKCVALCGTPQTSPSCPNASGSR